MVRGNVHVAEILRDDQYVTITRGVAELAIANTQNKCTLIEPFLITYNSKEMKAYFIPTRMGSEKLQFDHPITNVLQPIVVDPGYFRDAKSRFYPIITTIATTGESGNIDVYKLIVYKICGENEQVNITVFWQTDLPHLEGYDTSPKDLCTNSECFTFFRGIFDLHYVRFEMADMKIKCISHVPRTAIYMVADEIFLTKSDSYEDHARSY